MYKLSTKKFREKLKCETNTKEIKSYIISDFMFQFDERFDQDNIHANFEHGQWWITVYDTIDERDRIFSVNDAEVNGNFEWSFEEC